jgi:catechol 2,3-dioxygenase-like lactoylglutathione lyase family enzyme
MLPRLYDLASAAGVGKLNMPVLAQTVLLLLLSNVFMTIAWYGQLKFKFLEGKSLLTIILVSWAIAFFEYSGTPLATFAKPAGVPDPRAVQFDHVSFNVADERALESLRKRLDAFGCEVTTVVDHGFIHSVYFTDPNGIALEASWWVVDGTGRPTDYNDTALFGDPDPVPAIAELAAGGLEDLPRTQLT